MKVLIWILCVFANSLIVTLLKEAGITLGGIPTVILYGVTFWIARTLCKKWDEYKEEKELEKKPPVYHMQQDIETCTKDKVRFCRKCGAELLVGAYYCNECGTKVVKE